MDVGKFQRIGQDLQKTYYPGVSLLDIAWKIHDLGNDELTGIAGEIGVSEMELYDWMRLTLSGP